MGNKFRPKAEGDFVLYHDKNGKLRTRRQRRDAANPSPKQIEARIRFGMIAKRTAGMKGGDAVARKLVQEGMKDVEFSRANAAAPARVQPKPLQREKVAEKLRPLLDSMKSRGRSRLKGRLKFRGTEDEYQSD